MKRHTPKQYSRRQFIGQMSCAAVGSTALYSTLLNLALTSRASAQTLPSGNDYKALVCLFLAGGNDSYNMLVPRENNEFASYQTTRADLALDAEDLLDINDPRSGRNFGIHSSLPRVRDLYNSGDLAFVANVGTLVQPTTLDDVRNERAPLPLGLYSHSDQQMHWHSSTPDQRSSVGWLGKAADILHSTNENDRISMNISLSGSNILQSGNNIIPYSLTTRGAITLDNYDQEWAQFFRGAVDSLLDQEYQSLLKQNYAKVNSDAIDAGAEFNSAIDGITPFTTEFPDTNLGQRLRMIASSIAARGPLAMRRQNFFVESDGWDHHDEVLNSQQGMLAEVDEAVSAFWSAIEELGLQNDVTLFTASDFARTLTSNGQGSDHAWGGHQFVLGGGLSGGRIYGEYPEDLSLDNNLDVGRGRILPTTSVDEYFGELARWIGVSDTDLPDVLPNLDRFYTIGSETGPLGMFAQ
ncbi:DUF1501 domain-containing protein [Puniceicoccaceae bacterium K14]|nr:DUF1501 domain-containing protein [Puniceicoccaceae bacterium K14]